MESELYKQAKAEFEMAFEQYKRLVRLKFGFLPRKPPFHYSNHTAKNGRRQLQLKYFLKEIERLENKGVNVIEKLPNRQGIMNAEKYELAVFLHNLKIGETHVVHKKDWVSKKSPSEKLRRINNKTDKWFKLSSKEDGSGWDVIRVR